MCFNITKANDLLSSRSLFIVEVKMSLKNEGTPFNELLGDDEVIPNIEQLQGLASVWYH
jgi:hypothetical protein